MIIHIIREQATPEQIVEMLSEYETLPNYKTLDYGNKSKSLSDG